MKKEESDQKIMGEMERKELQERYIRFDWAIKRLITPESQLQCARRFPDRHDRRRSQDFGNPRK